MPAPYSQIPPLPELLASWGNDGCAEDVMAGWECSLATLQCDVPDFLKPNRVEEARLFAGLDPAYGPLLEKACMRIAGDPGLVALAWHTCRRAYLENETVSFRPWPELDRPLGRDARLFYLIVALASIPLMRQRHAERGIPEYIARDTASDAVEKCRRSALTRPDLPGLAPRELTWFQHHADASVFRLGRFQYRFRHFRGGIVVFRQRRTGETKALAEGGRVFDGNGFAMEERSGDAWESQLVETEHGFSGNPISRDGRAERNPCTLPRKDWEVLAKSGDPAFEIHVPAGGGMTLERCRESMGDALAFHRRHFPDRPQPKIFSCISWFLGPQLQEILPASANIVRFQRAAYLFPIAPGSANGFYFLFGQEKLPDRLPENASSLISSVFAYLSAGKPWRGGGMFVPADEVDSFGRD